MLKIQGRRLVYHMQWAKSKVSESYSHSRIQSLNVVRQIGPIKTASLGFAGYTVQNQAYRKDKLK